MMRPILGIALFLIIFFLIDAYAWKGIQSATSGLEADRKKWIKWLFWGTSIAIYGSFLWVFGRYIFIGKQVSNDSSTAFMLVGIMLLFLFPKLLIVLFHLLEDLVYGVTWVIRKLSWGNNGAEAFGPIMGRARFLSQIGLALSAIPFSAILYGITKGRSAFAVERVDISSKRLPESFEGFRIVQISDMHLGSLSPDNELVPKGVRMINDLKPDLILFTGDMVNDLAIEAAKWLDELAKLNAPHGVFSVLGNHDYADYFYGKESSPEKVANLTQLKEFQKKAGFDLLLDEHRSIKKNGQQIKLIGVQNYGGRGFAQYGDLNKALSGCAPEDFKLLMSHDPSHWTLQVLETDVDLTLAGHTHGMQFGFKYKGKRYSPVSMIYDQWAGLYEKGEQKLYVNRGFGYLGFPGRVGMSPEITLLTLRSA